MERLKRKEEKKRALKLDSFIEIHLHIFWT